MNICYDNYQLPEHVKSEFSSEVTPHRHVFKKRKRELSQEEHPLYSILPVVQAVHVE